MLPNQVVTGVESIEACESITAVEGFTVASGGTANMTAGREIVIGNGFSVSSGGTLAVSIDSSKSRAAYVQTESPRSETSFSISFWIDLDGLDVPVVDEVKHLVASSRRDGWKLRLLIRNGPTLVLQVRDDNGNIHSTSGVPVDTGWRNVTVAWEAAATATASLTVNGSAHVEIPGLDTGAGRIDFVRLGVVGGSLATTSGTILLDDYLSWRE